MATPNATTNASAPSSSEKAHKETVNKKEDQTPRGATNAGGNKAATTTPASMLIDIEIAAKHPYVVVEAWDTWADYKHVTIIRAAVNLTTKIKEWHAKGYIVQGGVTGVWDPDNGLRYTVLMIPRP